jgi:hypothetical protein
MGASFGYASAQSLDMSCLPLSRFESRAVCVVVCGLWERRGASKYSKQLHSKNSAQFYVLGPYMQHLPYLRAIKGHLRTYGHPTDKRPRTAPNRVHHRVPHSI